jgi:N-acetyl-beta-hexosaminidase
MQTHGLATFANGVWTYQWQNLTDQWEVFVQNVAKTNGKTPIVWEEAFLNQQSPNIIAPDTIVNIWQSGAALNAAVNAGHPVINSFGWYMDRQNPTCSSANMTDPSTYCPTYWMWEWTWHTMYAIDPISFLTNPTPAKQALVLGGEITIFGESVDPMNWEERVWTRAPVISERLWSQFNVTSIDYVQKRFSAFRCSVCHASLFPYLQHMHT